MDYLIIDRGYHMQKMPFMDAGWATVSVVKASEHLNGLNNTVILWQAEK